MTRVAIAFGSNLGNHEAQIARALEILSAAISWSACSHFYETAPLYVHEQPPFLNGVAVGTTVLGPIALVRLLKQTEVEVGRMPRQDKGPREIDLDLIVYGSVRFISNGNPRITVPHPGTMERRFVLEPLHGVWPDLVAPGLDVITGLQSETVKSQYIDRREDAPIRLPSG